MTAVVLLIALSFLQPLDAQMTCGPRVSPRMIQDVPCDMSKESFCKVPGSAYPFSSVRRYIYENQGLMRRMYGDQRQSFVLRNEIDDLRDKYDSLNFYGSLGQSFRRPGFGPRSMDDFHYVTNEDFPASPSPPVTSHSPNPSSTVHQVTPSLQTALSNTTSMPESLADGDSEENTTPETVMRTTPDPPATTPVQQTSSTTDSLTITPGVTEGDKPQSDKKKGVNACPVTEEVVAPFWANNTRGETLALLNVYPFEQYVHWEKCTFEFKQMFCRQGCRCEQQYRLHRLLAFDPKNDCRGVFADWFRFPSCCICVCYDIPENPLLYRVSRRKARL